MKVAFEKIAPLKHNFGGLNFVPQKQVLSPNNNFVEQNSYVDIPSSSLRAYFLNFEGVKKPPYTYTPISSEKPRYTALDCNYQDIDEFSLLYSKKVNSQLMLISQQDIQKLVARIKRKTKAPSELILDVLYKLTFYSNYNSLKKIEDMILRFRIDDFGLSYANPNVDIEDTSFNAALSYVVKQKKQAGSICQAKNRAIILDDRFLSWLEELKNSKKSKDKKLIYLLRKNILEGKVIPFVLPGWDVKCSDGRYRSANMFCGSGYLEDVAVDVVTRVQKGENLDDILYSDFSQRLKRILDSSFSIKKIQIPSKPRVVDDIYTNLEGYRIEPCDVRNLIEEYFGIHEVSKEYIEAFLKYLDNNTLVFSGDSLSKSLITLHCKLLKLAQKDGYPDDELVYVIPDKEKSFSYINSVYAKLNNVPVNKFYTDTPAQNWKPQENKLNPKVILDDISASGETQELECTALSTICPKSDLYYGSLVSSTLAARINSNVRSVSNYKFVDSSSIRLNRQKEQIIGAMFASGFKNISSVCAFPYMIPDTNCDFASLLFSKLLRKNTASANKGLEHSIPSRKAFYEKLSITPKELLNDK